MNKSPFRIYENLPPPPSDAITYSQVLERIKLGAPLIVADGMGVDSTWMLVLLAQHGIVPDVIQHASTGNEKPETVAYMENRKLWLVKAGFPALSVVKKRVVRVQDHSLEDQSLRTQTLPSLAYGMKSCSLKWKAAVMDRDLTHWERCRSSWKQGIRAIKVIGYDNGPSDGRRLKIWHDRRFSYWYVLRDPEIGGYDRDQCKEEIARAGEEVPVKSACFYCPASKKSEILWLEKHHPDLLERALAIEKGFREGRHYRPPVLQPNGKMKHNVEGLGRSWSWTDFIAQERLRREVEPDLMDFLLEYPSSAPDVAEELGCG